MAIKILIGFIIVVAIIIVIISIKLSNKVINPGKRSIEEALQLEIKNKKIEEKTYENLPKEDFKLKIKHPHLNEGEINLEGNLILREGLKNKADIIKNKEKVVILIHGFRFNRIGQVKYIDIFRKRNYNILIYDHRNCGNSDGTCTTMGHLEKQDLKIIIDEIRKIFGQNTSIGLYGESMGASTTLLLLELEDKLEFIIADCGYSELDDELAHQLKVQHKLPRFPFINIASLITKIRGGFYYKEVSPIKVISKYGLKVPILFIHGKEDNFTPAYMSKDMYKVRKKVISEKIPTELYLAPNSGHALSYFNNKEEYEEVVDKFLKKVNKI